MAKLKMKEIADIMKHIDICMLATYGARGAIESRPMSNNREVEYSGDNYFFTLDKNAVAKEITKNPQVNLSFIGHHSFLNRKSVYISVIGRAKLVKDKKQFEKHWTKDLDLWFKKGIDTPGLTLIHVRAKSLKYWDGFEEGEIKVK